MSRRTGRVRSSWKTYLSVSVTEKGTGQYCSSTDRFFKAQNALLDNTRLDPVLIDHVFSTTTLNADQGLLHLRREFARQGLTRKLTARIVWELVAHVTMLLGGSLLFLAVPGMGAKILGALLAALGCVGIASNTHTSSHFATGRQPAFNRFLTYFGYAFCLGFPAVFWWADHVKGHHAGPNVVGIDDDFDFLPLFAIDAPEVARATGLRKFYYERCQWVVLLLAVPLMSFNLQRRGFSYLIGEGRTGPGGKRPIPDILGMCLHALVFVVLPCFFFPISTVLALYACRMLLFSVGLFIILIPGHFPADAPLITAERAAELGNVTTQTLCTVNYDGGPVVRWFSSGLGYQIEHHLFPEISHPHYPKIAPLVEAYCRKYGLSYRSYPLGQALIESIAVFRTPKPVEG